MAGMPEVARATVTIIPNMKGSKEKISRDLGASTDKAGTTAGKSFGKSLIAGAAKVGAVVAVGKLIGDSLKAGGELEQNLGGTKAVFGDFAETIQNQAATAYKNMGLSASDYMATANKMGSLFQGSGLEQEKALDLTSKAMQRAADVASVMGIDASMAMESIAGAAKGNFTMMDNLGVAMNATTLQAYALEKGVNFKWDTASNAEKAELAMEMFFDRTSQYAGNYAKEAEETFSGSFESMKAAAEDLMGNLALGNDITPQLHNLGDAVGTFVTDNLVPMFGNIIKEIPTFIAQLPGMLADAIPSLASAAGQIVADLGQGIVDNAPVFLENMGELLGNVSTAVQNIDWEQVLADFETGVGTIWDSVTGLLETTFDVKIPDWETVKAEVTVLWYRVKNNIGDFFKSAFEVLTDDDKSVVEKIRDLWNLVRSGIGWFFKTTFEVLTPVAETITTMISNWWKENVWPKIQDFFYTTFNIRLPNWDVVETLIKNSWNKVKEGILSLFKAVFNVEPPKVEDIVSALETVSQGIYEGIAGFFKVVFNISIPPFTTVKEQIKGLWDNVKTKISTFFQKVFNVTPEEASAATATIKGLWDEVQTGIADFFKWVFSLEPPDLEEVLADLKAFWDKVVDGIGDFFTLKWLLGDPDEDIGNTTTHMSRDSSFSGGTSKQFEISEENVTINSESIESALEALNLTLPEIDTSTIDTAVETVTSAVSDMESAVSDMNLTLPTVDCLSIGVASGIVDQAVIQMQGAMNFSWSLPALHGTVPYITVSMRSASSSDGKTTVSYPEFNVGSKWFAKGGIFNQPSIIGVGEAGAEAALPLDTFWRRLDAEFDRSGSGATINNYIEVNGATDPVAYADELARELQQQLKRA